MDARDQQNLLFSDPGEFVRSLLGSFGLPAHPLSSADGWANRVWLAPAHVVRLSSGRFRDAYTHEHAVLDLLPDVVPHAHAVAHGHLGDREWMVLERMPGRSLIRVWPEMTESERQAATEQLGGALSVLHSVELPDSFANPWLDDALSPGGRVENAYHAPPSRYERLLEAAHEVPGVDLGVLTELEEFFAERIGLFAEDPQVLVHADAHFANLLWDGERLSAVLDFEGARPAAPDLELDTLLRFARAPRQYHGPGEPQHLSSRELAAFPEWLAGVYPELFSHPRLQARLQTYEALWQLVQLLHFPPGSGPPDPWGHLKSLLGTA